jgi:hypothetical protein
VPSYFETSGGVLVPATEMVVQHPDGSAQKTCPIQGLLDTGSFRTYVPTWFAEDLGLPAVDEQEAQGVFDRAPRRAPVCQARVRIAVFWPDFRPLSLLLHTLDVALIGRDVLDQFAVVFDGPAREFHVVRPEIGAGQILHYSVV